MTSNDVKNCAPSHFWSSLNIAHAFFSCIFLEFPKCKICIIGAIPYGCHSIRILFTATALRTLVVVCCRVRPMYRGVHPFPHCILVLALRRLSELCVKNSSGTSNCPNRLSSWRWGGDDPKDFLGSEVLVLRHFFEGLLFLNENSASSVSEYALCSWRSHGTKSKILESKRYDSTGKCKQRKITFSS